MGCHSGCGAPNTRPFSSSALITHRWSRSSDRQAERVSTDPGRYANGDNMRWALVSYSDRTDGMIGERAIDREQLVRLQCGPPVPGVSHFVEGRATDR